MEHLHAVWSGHSFGLLTQKAVGHDYTYQTLVRTEYTYDIRSRVETATLTEADFAGTWQEFQPGRLGSLLSSNPAARAIIFAVNAEWPQETMHEEIELGLIPQVCKLLGILGGFVGSTFAIAGLLFVRRNADTYEEIESRTIRTWKKEWRLGSTIDVSKITNGNYMRTAKKSDNKTPESGLGNNADVAQVQNLLGVEAGTAPTTDDQKTTLTTPDRKTMVSSFANSAPRPIGRLARFVSGVADTE